MSDASGDARVNDAYTIGAILQGAREASGESIEEVSRVLRINWRYLQALEDGQFDELPGAAYAIGFIRTYGDYLGINSADLIVKYKALNETGRSKSSLVFPEPIPESGLPGGAILFAGVVVAVLSYGVWYLATEENSFLARMVSPVPAELAEKTGLEPSSETAAIEETTPQPVVVEEPEQLIEEVVEEVTEQTTEDTATIVDTAANASMESQGEAKRAVEEVAAVTEETSESVIESAAETTYSDPVETPSAVTETEEVVETEVAATSETPEVVEEGVTDVPEPVQEQIVETTEIVSRDSTGEAIEEVTVEVIETVDSGVTDTTADVQETVAAQEDTESLALNEEQLRAAQASLGGSEPAGDGIVEDITATEPVAAPEPVAETSVEAVEEESTEAAAQQSSDVDTETSAADSEDNQVAAVPAEEPVRETTSGRVYGDEGTARIVVRAKTNSWIQVRDDTAGQLLLTRLLRAGDEYHVPDRDGLSLLTGNAGALEILVDGAQVPDIGGTGDVRRNVALDADRLKAGNASSN